MSLVNDALKRATEKHNSRPPVPVAPLHLRPVEPAQPQKTGIGLVLPATLLTIIIAALISISLPNHSSRSTAPISSPPSSISTATTTVPALSIMDLAPAPMVVSAKTVPVALSATTPVPAAVVAPPQLAPLRLQAVFYSPPNPSAIISGKTVHVGDCLRELQVVAIGSSSALLISSTQTNFLTLQ